MGGASRGEASRREASRIVVLEKEARRILEMIVGFGVAICVAGYAIHWHRERAKWAKVHEEQLGKLEQLKRLKWHKRKIG